MGTIFNISEKYFASFTLNMAAVCSFETSETFSTTYYMASEPMRKQAETVFKQQRKPEILKYYFPAHFLQHIIYTLQISRFK
jgi:hypothetical protein